MKQGIVLRLETNAAQYETIMTTLEAFNAACQYVADVAYEHRLSNKIALQPRVYNEMRTGFGLTSQMAVRAISRACDHYKQDKRVHIRFQPHDDMMLDSRLYSFKGLTHISLLCLSGRLPVPYRFLEYAPPRHDRVVGQADLLLREETFHLQVCIDMPTAPVLTHATSAS